MLIRLSGVHAGHLSNGDAKLYGSTNGSEVIHTLQLTKLFYPWA